MKIKVIGVGVLAIFLLLCGCTGNNDDALPQGALPLRPNYLGLTYLMPGEPDLEKYEDSTWSRYGHTTYVANVGGELAILPKHTDGSSAVPGVNRSQVYSVGELWGSEYGVFVEDKNVDRDPCVGIISSANGDRALVFTTSDVKSKILAFEINDQGIWSLQNSTETISTLYFVICDWPSFNYDAPEHIYLITQKEVLVLQAQDFLLGGGCETIEVVATLSAPDWWAYIEPTNGVLIGTTLFVGDKQGLIRIGEDGEFTYYPISYYKGG